MTYFEKIQELTTSVNPEIVDFSLPRDEANMPTQASSEFITNKEQGDWAETVLYEAINHISQNYVAVRYGKSDNLVAGDEGFAEFFQQYQEELDTIGKRPDLLIFKKEDYEEAFGMDLSHLDPNIIGEYVKKAIAGIEVRSSAFLIDHYDAAIKRNKLQCLQSAFEMRDHILSKYNEILHTKKCVSYLSILTNIDASTISVISYKVPGWHATPELSALNNDLKILKDYIKQLQKRDCLSITPKVEDLKIVYKWIKTYNVPHYYFQVFFDKIYGVSFENILRFISDSEKEGDVYFIESDIKNQNKTTIKIRSTSGSLIASRVDEPNHQSCRKELNRGRLLFYVTFSGGSAYLDIDNLKKTLGITGDF